MSTCYCRTSGHDYRCASAFSPFAAAAPAAARSSELHRVTSTSNYSRSWSLADVEILRSTHGRTVRAYAAVFDTPAEIRDAHGHYNEVIDRRAFNRQLAEGTGAVRCFFNHGMTIHGTPSELGAVPIGSPLEIRADGKGLLTVTRYNRSQLADAVLEAIRAGDLKGYSFRGRIYRSNPERIPRSTRAGALPTITRLELGLTEYGPTPSPAYVAADIVAASA